MTIDVRDFGAAGDGRTMDTEALQRAIDACARTGGRVILQDGVFLTGTLRLRSHVELHIDAGATLLASPRCGDYPPIALARVNAAMLPRGRASCLLLAEDCENVALTGRGTIDCSGSSFVTPAPPEDYLRYRRIDAPTPPRVIFLCGCRQALVQDVSVVNAPAGWAFFVHACDTVSLDRVKVSGDMDYPNNDGIHINCSRNVGVTDCTLDCSDDTIIVRANSASLPENTPCENVTVTGCHLHSHAAGIRVGWLGDGVIRSCAFTNLTMTDCTAGISFSLPANTGDARWPDQGREATRIENLLFSNIVFARGYDSPVYMNIADHPSVQCAGIRDVTFSHMQGGSARLPRLFGRADCPLERITFTDCAFRQLPLDAVEDGRTHGSLIHKDRECHGLELRHADVRFVNTSFSVI